MNWDGKRICGVADAIGGMECYWPFKAVSIFAQGSLGQVDLIQATTLAVAGWNQVCGINLSLTNNARTAHIQITTGGIDGPFGTLGWSELPCGFSQQQWRQLQQKYDTNEPWVSAENPPQDKIDAVRVICHELGHALGISHISGGNLMAPTYNVQVRWPQNGDILEARARYGLPGSTPAPTPTTQPPFFPIPDIPGIPGLPGIPVPGIPGGGGFPGIGDLLPCLLRYAPDAIRIFNELTPQQRSDLIKFLVSIWGALSQSERATLQQQIRELDRQP